MADFCVDCTEDTFPGTAYGTHDLGRGYGWALCEGCGFHKFDNGARACRRGSFTLDEAFRSMPCQECVDLSYPDDPRYREARNE